MNSTQNNCKCSNPCGSMVYLTKVFYDAEETASPILTNISTTAATFNQQLTVSDDICPEARCSERECGCQCERQCGCGCEPRRSCDCCCNFELSANAKFNISNAYVIVRSFDLSAPGTITDNGLTVDGKPVEDIQATGGQYLANLSAVMSEITKCPCKSPCANDCPGNFVFASPQGPWNLAVTIVLEGTVHDNGTACQFRVCFTSTDGNLISVPGNSTFAFCGVDIPCQVAGVAPSLLFDFDACAAILNPSLEVVQSNGQYALLLNGSLVVTPRMELKVTRPSLFCLEAQEVDIQCDDIGQCDPCNEAEAECLDHGDNCCCGQPRNEIQPARGITCQCCSTNGFSF